MERPRVSRLYSSRKASIVYDEIFGSRFGVII